MILSAFLLVLLSLTSCLAIKTEIINPIRTTGEEAALIIVPGAYIKGNTYKPLAQELQRTSNLKLWVALLEEFPFNLPNPLQLNGAIANAISSIKKAGMSSNNVFVAGHSLGGVFVGNYGKSHSSTVKGILLFGSYLTKGNKLSEYPVPVLTISGDLDGLTRSTRIADTFQELRSDAVSKRDAIYRTPVIIMPGVNHGQFASGAMPQNVLDYDLKSEVDASTAYKMISENVDNFMVSAIGGSGSAVSKARQALAQAYQSTNTYFTPLLNMKMMDINTQGYSNWSVEAQYIISGLDRTLLKVGNTEQSELPFIGSKPEVKTLASTEQITTHTHVVYPSNIMDVSTTKNTPDSLDVKMKSKQAVFVALPKGSKPPTGQYNKTCMDVNKAAWDLAYKSSSQVARQRFQSQKGRPMKFLPDVNYGTGIQWVSSSAKWEESDNEVAFTSTALLSKVDIFPASFAGMHYCKLLSPYRAMEWIYVDSLRHKAHKSGFLFG